ncbi:MAG: hypothetical protein HYZ75_18660 [Elusimicrobia bacterium]|nr:hypothetical protein [Elusimicrobiota bacterium]
MSPAKPLPALLSLLLVGAAPAAPPGADFAAACRPALEEMAQELGADPGALCGCAFRRSLLMGASAEDLARAAARLREEPAGDMGDRRIGKAIRLCLNGGEAALELDVLGEQEHEAQQRRIDQAPAVEYLWSASSQTAGADPRAVDAGLALRVSFGATDCVLSPQRTRRVRRDGALHEQALRDFRCAKARVESSGSPVEKRSAGCGREAGSGQGPAGRTVFRVFPAGTSKAAGTLTVTCEVSGR